MTPKTKKQKKAVAQKATCYADLCYEGQAGYKWFWVLPPGDTTDPTKMSEGWRDGLRLAELVHSGRLKDPTAPKSPSDKDIDTPVSVWHLRDRH